MDVNKPLEKAKLLNPSAPNRATGILTGECSGILHWNDIRYPQMHDLYQALLSNFWRPSDINMQDDVKQWDRLPDFIQDIFLRVNAQLAGLDSLQTPTIVELIPYFKDSSLRAISAVIGQQEAVHNDSYSYIMNTFLSLQDQKYRFKEGKEDPVILKRNQLVLDAYEEFRSNPTAKTFFKLLVNSVILEGVYFYAGFAFFYWLASKQWMIKSSTMISYIQKDEMQHAYFVAQLIRILQSEIPELATPEMNDYVKEQVKLGVQLEKEWAHHLFSPIDNADLSEYGLGRGIDIREFDLYTEYLANKRMRQMGFDNLYPEIDNPMPWIQVFSDEMMSNTKTDQFENKPRTYAMVSESNGFDEL